MYADFFGLRELPFNNTPDPRFFYSTPDHEEALASLIYAVQERKGFALLTGEVGAGKTLIARMMLRHFGNRIVFANINHALAGADDLLAAMCTEFDLNAPAASSNAHVVRLLHDFLLSRFGQDVPTVLVLDEAQALPDEAFEQLRMIGNLEADDAKLLQIVIVGQPELQDRFQTPQLRQLRQRIFRSFHLPALTQHLTEAYIQHRLSIAGLGEVSIFDGIAIERIYEHSKGLPRLINAICDNAMLSAYSANRRLVDGPFVETVINQMMLFDRRTVEGQGDSFAAPVIPAAPVHGSYGPPPAVQAYEWRPAPQAPNVVTAVAAASPSATDGYVRELVHREVAQLVTDLRMGLQGTEQRIGRLENDRTNDAGAVNAARAAYSDLWPLVEKAIAVVKRCQAGSEGIAATEARIAKMATKLQAVIEEVRRIGTGLEGSIGKARRAGQHAETVGDRLRRQSTRSREVARTLRDAMCDVDRRQTLITSQMALMDQASPTVGAVACGIPDPKQFKRVLQNSQKTLAGLRELLRSDRGGDVDQDDKADRSDARVMVADEVKSLPKTAVVGRSTDRLCDQVEDLLKMVGVSDSSPAPVATTH